MAQQVRSSLGLGGEEVRVRYESLSVFKIKAVLCRVLARREKNSDNFYLYHIKASTI